MSNVLPPDEKPTVVSKSHLEDLGRLAGGIAHDFNNLLTVISANLQLLELAKSDGAVDQYLSEITKATEMAARLNRRLMTFACQQSLKNNLIDINEWIKSTLAIARPAIGPEVTIVESLEATEVQINADISQIENAIINVALNARDAMPQGGLFTVETSNIVLLPAQTAGSGLKPGNYVKVRLIDSGTGMPAEVQSRAFEPFFTTKMPGQGHGLGLSIVRSFARQSGGDIQIESSTSSGTTIALFLPTAADSSDT